MRNMKSSIVMMIMNEQNLVNLTRKLISFPSVTPDEAGCLVFISDILKELGFKVFTEKFGQVTNLYAEIGDFGPNLCFAGHVDVVPPGDGWSDNPFSGSLKDNKIYGRGAVDMKGAIAAFIDAADKYLKNNNSISKKISFLLTSDEEVGSEEGTESMLIFLEKKGIKLDFVIVGEPTSEDVILDTVKIGRRGSVNIKLEIFGTQGHVAYPEKAHNPVPIAAKIAHELSNINFDSGNDAFLPSNLEVVSIDVGNQVSNIIPAKVEMLINIRFNNINSLDAIMNLVEMVVKSNIDSYNLDYSCRSFPFRSDSCFYHELFNNLVKKNTGYEPKFSTSGGTSDARFIVKHCKYLIEAGLRNKYAHKIDENVKIRDLQILRNVYYDFISSFS